MARASKGSRTAEALTVGLHTRISEKAETLLHERARSAGVKPATWARNAIYRALGLLKDEQ